MARRTKQQAEVTRSHILDTAELVFEERGVSGTSLNEIAKAAGLTRGAIYWHFADKADLFNAMMNRATLPLEETGCACGIVQAEQSLGDMHAGLVSVLYKLVADPQMQRVFTIARHKVEYVADMQAVRERHLGLREACLADIERTLRRAMRRGELLRRMPARAAAIGLHALVDGLIENWMLTPEAFDLVKVGRQAIEAYLGGFAVPAG